MASCISVNKLKSKVVKGYLQNNYAGEMIYVNVIQQEKERKTRAMAVALLKKNGFNGKEICKVMKMFPCDLRIIERA